MSVDPLKKFVVDAERLLEVGTVGEVVFSRSTYQLEIFEGKKRRGDWVFLQVDDGGALTDYFCTCAAGEDGCVHVAAAYQRIMGKENVPLHVRFDKSLWRALCHGYAMSHGYGSELLRREAPGRYRLGDVVSLEATGKDARRHLESILEKRVEETEKTSIKFSGLSEEEIARWREGRPSAALLFELSFWADLAKWFTVLQDAGEGCDIVFSYDSEGIPNGISVDFDEIHASFALDRTRLSSIIPALGRVRSPLQVHVYDEAGCQVVYDKIGHRLLVVRQDAGRGLVQGIPIGDWIFVPRDGFYPVTTPSVLNRDSIPAEEIAETLSREGKTVARLLQGTGFHPEPQKIQYCVTFDDAWRLHISSYLFEKDDLEREDSADFGSWVYLADDGFYPLQGREFDTFSLTVSPQELPDVLGQHRAFFNSLPGFRLHLASVEGELIYSVDEQGNLNFDHRVEALDDPKRHKDFGPWVYLAGQGFFAKKRAQLGANVQAKSHVTRDYVPVFIRMNRAELELVSHFFSASCPVIGASLRVELSNVDEIRIVPEYEVAPGKLWRLYDDIVYCSGEGFSELPAEARLPERFRDTVVIGKENFATFLAYELDRLKEYTSFIDPRLERPQDLSLVATQCSETDKGSFALSFEYKSEKGTVLAMDLWRYTGRRRSLAPTPAGLLNLDDVRFDWLWKVRDSQVDLQENIVRLSVLELLRLNALDTIHAGDPALADMISDLVNIEKAPEPDITGLTSELRPYQHTAARWLWFLFHHGLSGLLCDDMGLGKTHEAMALMAAVTNAARERPRFLVVCPTSVIYPWQEKLEAYLPSVKVAVFHGKEREEVLEKHYDILLTSYGILRNSREALAETSFDVAFFDEVQIAKNRTSRIHQALHGVNAKMRLGMTGTPIENRLWELKALFDVVIPGYMPSDAHFRDLFVTPIEREEDQKKRDLLNRFVAPFLLRRRKEDVLPDLPEKIEEIAHCELVEEQRELYEKALKTQRESLLRQLADEASPVPYLHVFALLTQLKQICNHPAVYLRDVENYQNHGSGKWDLFLELLGEARESGQKVVVFTQYLSMLDIMELYLRQQRIEYALIRGSTRNRPEELRRFNKDKGCEVFLGSLQAVGLGVDLTAGSVVIHYDRWWNAARENQATGRVHRIGQTRGVQVFKLVTLGSFEERIDALISRKGKLMEDIVGADDSNVLKLLDRDELIALLQL